MLHAGMMIVLHARASRGARARGVPVGPVGCPGLGPWGWGPWSRLGNAIKDALRCNGYGPPSHGNGAGEAGGPGRLKWVSMSAHISLRFTQWACDRRRLHSYTSPGSARQSKAASTTVTPRSHRRRLLPTLHDTASGVCSISSQRHRGLAHSRVHRWCDCCQCQ